VAELGLLYAGSSGFSYPSWKDGFYPPDSRSEDFLRLYSERLPTVELNTTFYRLPAEEQFDRWAAQTPGTFRFAVTMSRGTTSFGRIRGLDAATQTISTLGDRLGPVRIKVPQARDNGFLRLLLDSLDPAIPWALDFRHDSWADAEIQHALDEHRVARVDSLTGEAPFRYIRLREPPYDDRALTAIAEVLRPLLARGVDVYAYFRHEDEPTAPLYAERLLELAGRSRSR
jgi:uncharacterized protein YecE (DUF72 family)